MGGLRTQTAPWAVPDGGTTSHGLNSDVQTTSSDPNFVESHLDSIFRNTGWTREDVDLILQAIATAILVYWAMKEVSG